MMTTRGRGGRLSSKRNREDLFLNLLMQDVNHHSTSDSDSQNDMDEEHDMSENVNIEQVISERVNIEHVISESFNARWRRWRKKSKTEPAEILLANNNGGKPSTDDSDLKKQVGKEKIEANLFLLDQCVV